MPNRSPLTSNFPKKSPPFIFFKIVSFSSLDNGELETSMGTFNLNNLLDVVVVFVCLWTSLNFCRAMRWETLSSISGWNCTGLCVNRRDVRDGDGVTNIMVDKFLFDRIVGLGVDGCRRERFFLASSRPRLARRSSFRLIRSRRNCSYGEI